MKKLLIKIIIFITIFSLFFNKLQSIINYRWTEAEDLYTKNIDYINHKDNTIDVLCFGTSELYAGYAPIITFDEKGITGYNFATSQRSAITQYYQLIFALKYQNPKIVICDFSSLFDNMLPKDNEALYRKVVSCMPDAEIKNKLIKTICKVDKTQSIFFWKFPLLRYHSMWNELNKDNFTDVKYNSDYPAYSKGALLSNKVQEDKNIEIVSEMWQYVDQEYQFSTVSVEYYDSFISECKKRNIIVIGMISPYLKPSEFVGKWPKMKEYFDSRKIDYLNYNTYDQIKRIGLNASDYYDGSHLNTEGSIKFSKIIAQDLSDRYDLTNNRNNNYYYEEWIKPLALFKRNTILH